MCTNMEVMLHHIGAYNNIHVGPRGSECAMELRPGAECEVFGWGGGLWGGARNKGFGVQEGAEDERFGVQAASGL